MFDKDKYIYCASATAIAEIFGVSRRTISRRVEEDDMPHKVIDGRIRFNPTEVLFWWFDFEGEEE